MCDGRVVNLDLDYKQILIKDERRMCYVKGSLYTREAKDAFVLKVILKQHLHVIN